MSTRIFCLAGLTLALIAQAAWAQPGGDRGGGDRGGGDRGRSGFGGPPGGWSGGPPGGWSGGGPPGGFSGGPPGGFGGGPPGGFGGGSFSPMDMLRRFDRNSNNMLDPDEMQGPARFFLERMAQNNPRIDLNRPIPLDRLAGEMDRMRQGGGGPGGPPGGPSNPVPSKPAEPEPLVPGFDKVEERQGVPGFGLPDMTSSIKVEERDLREAADRVQRYDTNKDGILSKEEIQNGRWSDDPMQYDRNRDGRLSKEELAVRYAKRRLSEQGGQPGQPGQPGQSGSNDPRSRLGSMGGPSGSSGWSGSGGSWGGRDLGGDNGGGWGSRDGGGDRGGGDRGGDRGGRKEEKADPKSYRAPSSKEKADGVKGLPDWFARSDADGDGQVMMSEFSSSWDDAKVAEFLKFDLNRDGIITSRECLAALKNGGSSAPAVAATSGGASSSSSSASPSIVSSSNASPDDKNREWALRQIEKYDKNKDGQLTVDEWSAMIVKPEGADFDKNGVITLEEYVKFRAK